MIDSLRLAADVGGSLLRLSDMGLGLWLLWLVGLVWLNVRAGLPRSATALKLRAAGFGLTLVATVLSFGRGLVAIYPWPLATALIGCIVCPLLMGLAWRQRRWGWITLPLLAWPVFGLVALTGVFGLLLDLRLLSSALLWVSLGLTGAGGWWVRRDPDSLGELFRGLVVSAQDAAARHGPAQAANDSDIVDVEARRVDEPPVERLPNQPGPPPAP